MILLFIIGAYFLGWAVCVSILARWGKDLGWDYSDPEPWIDDWQSNKEAYAGISLAWPIILLAVTLALTWKFLLFVADALIHILQK
jgi:hypothetical protein